MLGIMVRDIGSDYDPRVVVDDLLVEGGGRCATVGISENRLTGFFIYETFHKSYYFISSG